MCRQFMTPALGFYTFIYKKFPLCSIYYSVYVVCIHIYMYMKSLSLYLCTYIILARDSK